MGSVFRPALIMGNSVTGRGIVFIVIMVVFVLLLWLFCIMILCERVCGVCV